MYEIVYTKTFLDTIKNFRKDKQLMQILFKRIARLRKEPRGKLLKGRLKNYRSIRIKGVYRLVFKVDERKKRIFLIAFAHRKIIYEYVLSFMKG